MERTVIAERPGKTLYRQGDHTVKVFEPSYSKAEVLNEALNYASMEDVLPNVPRLIDVGVNQGKWSLTTEFIEGETLADLMDREPENEDEYIRQFAELHLTIMGADAPFLNRQRDKMHVDIEETELNATTRFHLHTKLNNMPVNLKVCHGDYNPTNVVRRHDGRLYVLDWAHACVGNATADAATTYLMFLLHDKKERGEKYIALYCQRTGRDMDYVNRWMPLVAAARYGSCKPGQKAMLMSIIQTAWE